MSLTSALHQFRGQVSLQKFPEAAGLLGTWRDELDRVGAVVRAEGRSHSIWVQAGHTRSAEPLERIEASAWTSLEHIKRNACFSLLRILPVPMVMHCHRVYFLSERAGSLYPRLPGP